MNREIKFRIWNIEENNWQDLTQVEIERTSADEDEPNHVFKFDTENSNFIKLQYTGLKDINDKDIYEGDILILNDEIRGCCHDDPRLYPMNIEHYAPVVFHTGAFGIKVLESGDFYIRRFYSFQELDYAEIDYLEIVGNIYENPELIKK